MDKPRYYASREFPIQNFHGRTTDNHIPRDDIFDYHPLRECNNYILSCFIYHANKC